VHVDARLVCFGSWAIAALGCATTFAQIVSLQGWIFLSGIQLITGS